MEMYNLNDSVAYCEAQGLSNIWKAYANFASGEGIMEIGFNPNTGYVYMVLDNYIQIASCMGQSVEYILLDYRTGEETFFDTYNEAIELHNQLF